MTRTPYNGEPYYCTYCGMGWNEFLACEDVRCVLESKETAEERNKKYQEKTDNEENKK